MWQYTKINPVLKKETGRLYAVGPKSYYVVQPAEDFSGKVCGYRVIEFALTGIFLSQASRTFVKCEDAEEEMYQVVNNRRNNTH